MVDQAKNMLIGIFVLSAAAIFIFALLYIHPSIGDEGKKLIVRFTDIDKISEGTRVTFAGKPVGEVEQIHFIKSAETTRRGKNGKVYIYELELLIDSGINVFNSDEITTRTSGLLGEKSVAIVPRPPKPGEKLVSVEDQILYAKESGTVEDTFKEFKEVADKFDVALDNLYLTLDEIRQAKLIDNLGDAVNNIRRVTEALNRPEEWSDILTNIHKLSEDAMEIAQTLNRPDELRGTIDNIYNLSQAADRIVTDIGEGKGTVGKIFVKDDLYLRLSSLLSKGEIILDDINHYGLLFHSDSNWKRIRARRMNLLHRLSSPQEFRNFFNDEVDQIATSISRVSSMLDTTSTFPMWHSISCNPQFIKVFAELLRRVDTLQESIEMYNQQLMESEILKTEFSQRGCY